MIRRDGSKLHTVGPIRASCLVFRGETGYIIRCKRNPDCVNPDHLSTSTKRVYTHGFASPVCRVSRETVDRIKQRWKELVKPGVTAQAMATKYNTSRQAISVVVRGLSAGGVKLSPSAIADIRENCRSGSYGTIKLLSNEFKLSQSVIKRAISGYYDED